MALVHAPETKPVDRPFDSVEYLSVLDRDEEDINANQPDSCSVIFDAVPKQILPFLRTASADDIVKNIDDALSFLLMQAKIPIAVYDQVSRMGGWCSITVSDIPRTDAGFFQATAIEFSDDQGEQAPTRLWVKINPSPPDPKDVQALNRFIECQDHPDAAFDSLGIAPKGDLFVAVYDVGQANMCAVIDENHRPKAFFDLGWPLRFYRRSLPLCTDFDPLACDDPLDPAPVILSHPDWDHWGYAYASGRAVRDSRKFWKTEPVYRTGVLERPWWMRRASANMKLGVSYAHLQYALRIQVLKDGSSALKFWPAGEAEVQWGACTLFACNPGPGVHDAKYLRNNEALGLLVENQQSYYYRRVLLSGDADYPSIPTRFKEYLGGIVAPHHGGRVSPGSIPAPDVDAGHDCYMVFSTSDGCYQQIPSPVTDADAKALGWKISRTDSRKACYCGSAQRRNRWFALSTEMTPKYNAPWECKCLGFTR